VTTVDKAMQLLSCFTPAQPEIGLSEIARKASLDKAAARRFLVSLSRHGFIEQNTRSKGYRLGPAFLRYAKVREATFPFASVIQPILEDLAATLGESAHVSVASNRSMMTIGIAEPQHRMTRVYVDPSQPLPLHATASGLAYLAFAPPGVLDDYVGGELPGYTERTIASPKRVRRQVADVFARGHAIADRSFELEVVGLAAPIFDASNYAIGAIAVASVASRFDGVAQAKIAGRVVDAAILITRAKGVEPHANLLIAQAALRSSR
jgi:DNA-binding IclR family transcriptional regulator